MTGMTTDRIANRLKVAELHLGGVGPYLSTADWASIVIPEDEHE